MHTSKKHYSFILEKRIQIFAFLSTVTEKKLLMDKNNSSFSNSPKIMKVLILIIVSLLINQS
jgi:hypothetical protein